MNLQLTTIPGLVIIDVEAHVDERGTFARTYDAALLEARGMISFFPQHSVAENVLAGALRGLHYQLGEEPEAKIVRCTRGSIFDVVVDVRHGSATFGQWVGVELDDESRRSLYIPPGCAHGYQATTDHAECLYLISTPYVAQAARGIHYADPGLNITWPLAVTCISERDRDLPSLERAELPASERSY